ncbi:putative baseplate assembly protein [Pseudonocardia charpentierae]|uniref:Baseplate assembly protein n=1 Tax=Pseudonocardia charpentierae TaxID=3075545 RepID=A0ABU2N3D1_9PSEU|nr:putative baseplate assembly protein [Pseudonocardia sp. DSM 45834]MDT0348427.1 putative baseplate assembly protein [Pseudonocardia sp. DSM 45834]
MVLPAPHLDDRDFQSLVDDAKRLVQQRSPDWTDHNVSDPGVTLIEAFAQMVDQLIYRLNRVPDRHYVKFLELIGLQLYPSTAARGTATFWLAAAQPATVLVRAETEVATPRTEVDEPVVFSTVADLPIVPCSFSNFAAVTSDGAITDHTRLLAEGADAPAFSTVPVPGETMLIGLSAAVPSCAVLLRINCPVGGIGIDPRNPPLAWEAWNGSGWSACEVDRDETGGLNKAGDVVLHVPGTHEQSVNARQRAGWLRCRVLPPDGVTPAYTRSPRISGVQAMTIGGTAGIAHAETVRDESLGTSDGAPGQRFTLQRHPVVPWTETSVLQVTDPGAPSPTSWVAVRDFAHSGPDDRHYRLDPVAGEVQFGPEVRHADGELRQYGAVPPLGSRLVMTAYRVGGGRRGNVARGVVRVLKSSVPYVTQVENRHPASGGVDGETMDNAKLRGPLELRASGRAVTADDFEVLARDVAPDAARVACLPATTTGAAPAGTAGLPGAVRLLVVPRVVTDDLGRIAFDDLRTPPRELLRRISDHLDRRRLVGTRLVVEPPVYQGVTVVARVTAGPDVRADAVQDAALRALYAYLSPQDGGPDGKGWPFGRAVRAFDVSAVLARVPGLAEVDDLLLFPADPASGNRGAPVARVDVAPGALVYSYQHQVRVQG